jgi:hypothetical protein
VPGLDLIKIILTLASNVCDIRGRVDFELSIAFAQQKFDGGEIFSVHGDVLVEFVARESLKMRTFVGWLRSGCSQALAVKGENISLESG